MCWYLASLKHICDRVSQNPNLTSRPWCIEWGLFGLGFVLLSATDKQILGSLWFLGLWGCLWAFFQTYTFSPHTPQHSNRLLSKETELLYCVTKTFHLEDLSAYRIPGMNWTGPLYPWTQLQFLALSDGLGSWQLQQRSLRTWRAGDKGSSGSKLTYAQRRGHKKGHYYGNDI